MDEIAAFVVSGVLNGVLAMTLVLRDERRLSPEQADRAWPASSRWAAVIAFGPLSVPVHFWRTRHSPVATLLGVGLGAAIAFASSSLGELVASFLR